MIALRQRGVTIVELMIGITIGLVVMLFVSNAFLNGVSTQSSQNGLTRLQESGRFALQLFENEISKAGFHNSYVLPATFVGKTLGPNGTALLNGTTVNLVQGVDGGPVNVSANSFGSDSLTVAFYGENDPSLVTNTPDGHILDCMGNSISRDTLVVETFSVVTDPNNNNEPSLGCQITYVAGTAGVVGPGGATVCAAGTTCKMAVVPIIPQVESLQFLYGVDTPVNGQSDGVVNWYANAGDLASTDWTNVISVRISLVVRSSGLDKVNAVSQAQTWNHFGITYAPGDVAPVDDSGSVYSSPADNRFRLMFSSVVALRNYGS